MNADYFRELIEIVHAIASKVDLLEGEEGHGLAGRVSVLQTAMEERRSVEFIRQRRELAKHGKAA